VPVPRGQDGARAGLVRSGDAPDVAERSVVPRPVPPLAAQFIEHSGVQAMLYELSYDDDLDADRIVGATGSRVPGSKGCPVLLGGEGHERVVDCAARDAEAAQRVWQLPRARATKHERRGEPVPLEYSIDWLTCAVASRSDAVVAG
jgi:hypothetical protein